MKLPIGTKSLLWGSHQFILHPLMVAYGWRRHYGFWPRGWRTWVAIFCHDLGYWGLADLDGERGKLHPLWAATRLANWFAPEPTRADLGRATFTRRFDSNLFWFWFLAAHSRHAARSLGWEPSPLMIPDKLATALLPRWLYALLVWLSGEHVEYIAYALASGHDVPRDAWGYSGWLLDHWRGQFLDRE